MLAGNELYIGQTRNTEDVCPLLQRAITSVTSASPCNGLEFYIPTFYLTKVNSSFLQTNLYKIKLGELY